MLAQQILIGNQFEISLYWSDSDHRRVWPVTDQLNTRRNIACWRRKKRETKFTLGVKGAQGTKPAHTDGHTWPRHFLLWYTHTQQPDSGVVRSLSIFCLEKVCYLRSKGEQAKPQLLFFFTVRPHQQLHCQLAKAQQRVDDVESAVMSQRQ